MRARAPAGRSPPCAAPSLSCGGGAGSMTRGEVERAPHSAPSLRAEELSAVAALREGPARLALYDETRPCMQAEREETGNRRMETAHSLFILSWKKKLNSSSLLCESSRGRTLLRGPAICFLSAIGRARARATHLPRRNG